MSSLAVGVWTDLDREKNGPTLCLLWQKRIENQVMMLYNIILHVNVQQVVQVGP